MKLVDDNSREKKAASLNAAECYVFVHITMMTNLIAYSWMLLNFKKYSFLAKSFFIQLEASTKLLMDIVEYPRKLLMDIHLLNAQANYMA